MEFILYLLIIYSTFLNPLSNKASITALGVITSSSVLITNDTTVSVGLTVATIEVETIILPGKREKNLTCLSVV